MMRHRLLLYLLPGLIGLTVCLAGAAARADILYLRDGTVIRGSLAAVTADSVRFDASFGSTLRVARSEIVRIVFDEAADARANDADSRVRTPMGETGGGVTGEGTVTITFKNVSVSSKIRVDRGRDLAGHLRANRLVQLFLVDGDTAYVHVDSTMDKTIYEGPRKIYKNSIKLKDFTVRVPAGEHRLTLLLVNAGREAYAGRFERDPVSMEIGLGEVRVPPSGSARFRLGVRRGKLRMGAPEFYVVE